MMNYMTDGGEFYRTAEGVAQEGVLLGDKLGDGFTAEVHRIVDAGGEKTGWVAKVVKEPFPFRDDSAAWIKSEYESISRKRDTLEGARRYVETGDLLVNTDGRVCGYTMKEIEGQPLFGYCGRPIPKEELQGLWGDLTSLCEQGLPHGDLKCEPDLPIYIEWEGDRARFVVADPKPDSLYEAGQDKTKTGLAPIAILKGFLKVPVV